MNPRIFIFGAGYSARAFAAEIRQSNDFLGGTTRSPAKTRTLDRAGIAPFLFDGVSLSLEIIDQLKRATHLVVSAGPNEDGDPVLNAAENVIREAMPALRWIGYLSSVGVYGDHQGAWVTEESECRPDPGRSGRRVEAEEAWLTLGHDIGRPVAVLRLSGIYGPGRNALVNLANGTARRIVKQGQIFNRIHADDIAGALAYLSQFEIGGVFNVSDDEPAPPQDVIAYAASLMGVEPPPEIPFEAAELSAMARSFYGEVKRVSSAKLKARGYSFRLPNYRIGLDQMWAKGIWKEEER